MPDRSINPISIDTALPPRGGGSPAVAAKAAEDDGYQAIWATEINNDPFVQLTLAATSTESIKLGTGIAVAFARNPMNTAMLAHQLQSVSNGRFMLGLGTQVRAHITRRFSMPWSKPAARMREYVLALRDIWSAWETGDKLDFEGEFYTHTLMAPMFTPLPHGHATPPVVIAGVGEQMTVVAGEVGDGMLVHSFVTEKYVREQTIPALERGRAKSTREHFETVGAPFVATGNTPEEIAAAVDAVRSQVAFYASTPAYRPVLEIHGWGEVGDHLRELTRAGEWDGLATALPDEVLAEFVVVGDPEEAADALWKRYGTLFDRYAILTPYELDASARLRVANRLRQHL